jgi:hypothetical protein
MPLYHHTDAHGITNQIFLLEQNYSLQQRDMMKVVTTTQGATWAQWRTEKGGGGLVSSTPPTPGNSEVLTKLSRISSSVENTSVTT